MEVLLAESAGFCFGVERAIHMVYEQIEKEKGKRRIYTYGPIIHNNEVVKDLENKDVFSIEGEEGLQKISGSVLIIRSHGVSKKIYDAAEKNGIEIVDATCPFVKKIHNIVREESREGKFIVIFGDREHPEVKGITGWVEGPFSVINSQEEAEMLALKPGSKVCVVSQTTFSLSLFQDLVEIINKKGYDTNVINTICNATKARQEEAESIACRVDKMIVIGDIKSSNTQKLVNICKTYCNDTYYIQTLKDLDLTNLQEARSVGITAGASTPNNIIREVFLNVRGKKL